MIRRCIRLTVDRYNHITGEMFHVEIEESQTVRLFVSVLWILRRPAAPSLRHLMDAPSPVN